MLSHVYNVDNVSSIRICLSFHGSFESLANSPMTHLLMFGWGHSLLVPLEVTQQSDSCQLGAVYGTPYDTRDELVEAEWMPGAHPFYPQDFKSIVSTFLLCLQRPALAAMSYIFRGFGVGNLKFKLSRFGQHHPSKRQFPSGLPMPALQSIFSFLSSGVRSVIRVDTVFPSGVQSDGAVDGGLILLRLHGGSGQVRLTLRYEAEESWIAWTVSRERNLSKPHINNIGCILYSQMVTVACIIYFPYINFLSFFFCLDDLPGSWALLHQLSRCCESGCHLWCAGSHSEGCDLAALRPDLPRAIYLNY